MGGDAGGAEAVSSLPEGPLLTELTDSVQLVEDAVEALRLCEDGVEQGGLMGLVGVAGAGLAMGVVAMGLLGSDRAPGLSGDAFAGPGCAL